MAYSDIKDPSAHFQAFTYTGIQTNQSITLDGNSDLQPDVYWYKARNTNYHYLVDSSRGTTKYIYPNDSLVEGTVPSAYVTSFDTNGVTLGGGDSGTNTGSVSFANWVWKANGGTTASNTSGSTTTTVQANQDAGFSIVTYVSNGNAANQTLGHGLGVAPDVIISKRRGGTADWMVYHKSLGVGSIIYLSSGNAASTSSPPYKDTPTSTVFSTQNQFQASDNFVSYCFAEKQGYSKFGSYVGNGNADGPFVYTGFKPAFIMVKSISATGSWRIWDSARDPFNDANNTVHADLNTAENAHGSDGADILSNGFKARDTGSWHNASGVSYIYMAFAENPFVAGGVPTTAR
jgi:hypothetical protein